MPALSRADNSLLGRWWWTVDRWTLGALGLLIAFGFIMMQAASPAVAERIGTSRDLFILKQVIFLVIASGVVVGVSLLSPRNIKRLAIVGGIVALGLTMATMVVGMEIKGARRWISLPGMSVQPSEFLKPCFAVVAAWLLAEGRQLPRFPGMAAAFGVFAVIVLLLKSQPDVGMLAVISMDAGSRPAPSAAPRTMASSSGDAPLAGKNPSARRPARAAAAFECPPMTSGTVPFTGFGRI